METSVQNNYSNPMVRLDSYRKKLEDRNNNDEWIFGNVFGKPGGGAPLRDKTGQVISKRKTIADGNIDRLNPEEFSRGNNNVFINHQLSTPNFFHRDPRFYQGNYFNNDPNNFINYNQGNNYFNKTNPLVNYNNDNMDFIQGNFNNSFQYENNKTDNNWYNNNNNFNNFGNNYNNFNNNYYNNNPYMMQQYPYLMPLPIFNPYQFQNPMNQNINNTLNNNKINNKNNIILNGQNIINNNNMNNIELKKKTPQISKESIFNNINPESKEPDMDMIKRQNEIKKEEFKNELLKQISEKKKRDEEEKKKNEELDRQEEIKYEEYLKLKKKQHEQQEIKRKHNLNKKLQMAYGESHLNPEKTQYTNFNNSYSIINEIPDNFIEEENKNEINLFSPNEELKQQEEFKKFIESEFGTINSNLNKEIDEQMKKIHLDYQKNYSPFTQILLNSDPENNLERNKEYQEKKNKHAQELIQQKNMVDYILGKIDEPSNFQINPQDLKIPIPSYFGTNRENPDSIYPNANLHSTSDFIINDGFTNKFPQNHFLNNNNNINNNDNNINNNNNDNDSKINNENINEEMNEENKDNENIISNLMSGSLDHKSSFIPIDGNENINKNQEIVKLNKNEMDINERRDFTDLFKKLDEITQLSKNIDPSTKLAGINSAYSIDLNRLRKTGTYERFDYEDDMFDLNKNKNYNKNLEKNSVELPSVNERISFQNPQINNNNDNNFSNEDLNTTEQVKKLINGQIYSSSD